MFLGLQFTSMRPLPMVFYPCVAGPCPVNLLTLGTRSGYLPLIIYLGKVPFQLPLLEGLFPLQRGSNGV